MPHFDDAEVRHESIRPYHGTWVPSEERAPTSLPPLVLSSGLQGFLFLRAVYFLNQHALVPWDDPQLERLQGELVRKASKRPLLN